MATFYPEHHIWDNWKAADEFYENITPYEEYIMDNDIVGRDEDSLTMEFYDEGEDFFLDVQFKRLMRRGG